MSSIGLWTVILKPSGSAAMLGMLLQPNFDWATEKEAELRQELYLQQANFSVNSLIILMDVNVLCLVVRISFLMSHCEVSLGFLS